MAIIGNLGPWDLILMLVFVILFLAAPTALGIWIYKRYFVK